jgi:hypothetical protein
LLTPSVLSVLSSLNTSDTNVLFLAVRSAAA